MDETTELEASLLLAAAHEETLIRALEDRLTVGQALGVLMGRHHVDAEHAMHMLASEAARRGVRLHEAALSTIEACMESSPLAQQ